MRPLAVPIVLVALAAVSAAAGDGPAPAPPAAAGRVPVEKFFHGRITKLEGRTIELVYDFETPAQLEDFDVAIPFRAIKTAVRALDNGQLHLTGTGSVRHKAVFAKSVEASATLTPVRNKNLGFAVTEERESEIFTLYCLADMYFLLGDGKTGPENMIIKFIPRDPRANRNGAQDWRYCGTHGAKPEIARGVPYKVSIARGANESRFSINDWETRGKEADRDLTSQMVSLYGYDADFKIDDLVVRGDLDAGWVERMKIDLTTFKPAPPPDPAAAEKPAGPTISPEAAARVLAKIAGWPAETKPNEMAALLRDATIPQDLRASAAEKAISAGQKRIVPYLVDGLYADDEPSRRLSYQVIEKLVGKTFAYRADAPEDARKKGIQAINDFLKKHAADFE